MKKQDSLALSTAKLGKQLMMEAQEQQADRMRSEVRVEFEYVLTRIHQHHMEIEAHEEKLEFFLKKKAALENGKFTVTSHGRLQMDDDKLQLEMVKPLGSY